jgi:CDP-glucose 4,6-dehydratase
VEFKHRTLEKLVKMDFAVLDGARILVTGHTGFKGFWLSRLLQKFGTEVHGISLAPELGSLFDRADCADFASSHFLDITRQQDLLKLMKAINPDAVIHMAAQPLVRHSYREPLLTFNTNVIGTANVLESLRNLENARGAVVVTSDKVYKNLETGQAYKENDELGGKDPYSASKSASEMVVSAWRNLMSLESEKILISARAGNIIGGGDHSKDRIVPDLIRAFKLGTPAVLRNPNAIRPWQHVLDPLMGYVTLVSRILRNDNVGESFNFGPNEDSKMTVAELTEFACNEWGNTASWIHQENQDSLPEANLLWLDSNKANNKLLWSPKLNAYKAVSWTVEWEKKTLTSTVEVEIDSQITKYMELST